MKPSLLALLSLALLATFEVSYYYPRLPETVASHFGPGGRADNFLSKSAFVTVHLLVTFGSLLIFGLLPVLLRRLPNSLINLPNRDYWLTAERRRGTFDFIGDRLRWFGAAALLFYVVVMYLVIQVNLSGTPVLPAAAVWALLGLYVIFVAYWTTGFIGKFRKTH